MTEDIENSYIESALLRIQRLKSRVVTQISHEFRTPLTSIIGLAEMLQDTSRMNDNERVEYAQYIQKEGLRLAKLVDDLLQLDALEHGRIQFHLHESVLQEIVCNAIARVTDFAISKSITISKKFPVKPLKVKLDYERMIQSLISCSTTPYILQNRMDMLSFKWMQAIPML